MLIKASATVQGAGYNAAFPYATSPAYVHTDLIYSTHPSNWGGSDNFVSVPDAECIIPAPMKVWHNNYITGMKIVPKDNSLPEVWWTADNDNEQLPTTNFSYPQMFSELMAPINDPASNVSYGALMPDGCIGFTFLYKRTDKVDSSKAGTDGATADTSTSLRLEVGWGIGPNIDESLYYALRIDEGSSLIFGCYADPQNPDNFTEIKKIDYPSDSTKVLKGSYSTDQEYQMVELMIAGGKVFIACGAETFKIASADIVVTDVAAPSVFEVYCVSKDHSTLFFSVHPMKFNAYASLISTQFPIGFTATSEPSWEIIPAGGWQGIVDPVGVDIQVMADPAVSDGDSLQGPIVTYLLSYTGQATGTFKGTDYVDNVVAIKGVNFFYKRGPLITPWSPVKALEPESVDVQQVFDLGTLSIHSSATLNFNNDNGFWGNWSQNSGHIAVAIEMGMYGFPNGYLPGPIDGSDTNNLIFSGIGHHAGTVSSQSGSHIFSMQCVDRVAQLQSPRWALPWMDGWNSLYAIAYLAGLGGVTLEDIAFAQYVPDSPWGDNGDPSGSPYGVGAYFLPVGYYSTQLTRFSGQSLWEIMCRIAQSIGYMVYFDRYGKLHFEKFNLPEILQYAWNFPTKRRFYESDAESTFYGESGNTGCWNLEWTKNMGTVRNKAIIVGIDARNPAWRPIVISLTDQHSITDPGASNFLGYPNPFVWADNQFADSAYAYDACRTQLLIMRVPEQKISITTWGQPDIYPLDLIQVNSAHAGTWGSYGSSYAPLGANTFLVTSVSHHLDQRSGIGRSTLQGLAMNQFASYVTDYGY